MIIKEIVARAGRTLNHPTESYANIRPDIEIRAQLEEGEDYTEAIRKLQSQAEQLVEDHARNLIDSLIEADQRATQQRRIESLESSIRHRQIDLQHEREEYEKLTGQQNLNFSEELAE